MNIIWAVIAGGLLVAIVVTGLIVRAFKNATKGGPWS